MTTTPVQYRESDPDPRIKYATDPWLQHPDGTVVALLPVLDTLPRDPATADCDTCTGTGVFAPTGNGPTQDGIERCDDCGRYDGDLTAAAAVAAHIGQGVTVWFEHAPKD